MFKRLELLGLEERITPATYTVTSNADSGAGTLRQAIIDANATVDNDSINFGITGTITLASSLPAIVTTTTAGTLAITGPGATSLTISGNNGNAARNFNIFNIDSGGNLSISGVTVSGAQTTIGGGAFYNAGALTINNSIISNNIAYYGGGIENDDFGILTISNSTLSSNSATINDGGAIDNSGTLNINNSTLSNNSATLNGGAIWNGGSISVTNSTFSANTANGSGGGIYNSQFNGVAGSLRVTNTTLSGNSASSGNGGGIFNDGGSFLNIANTIIANSPSGGDYAGTGSVSLISPATSSSNLVTQSGQLVSGWAITVTSASLKLGPLQNNGGPTFTMALLAGSAAISAGDATISNASPVNGLDQRGFNRTTSDIGAYSYNFASASDAVVSLDNSNQVVITLSAAGTTLSDVHTTFNSGNNTLAITAATTGNLITAPAAGITGVTINAGSDTITLDLNTLVKFAGIVIVGTSGTDSVTIGTGGVNLSAVTTGAANQSFTANILGTNTSTSSLVLTNAIKTKGAGSTYLTAGSINGAGLVTTPTITLTATNGIGNMTALNLAAATIAADSTTGPVVITNALGSAVTVTSLTSTGTSTNNPTGPLLSFTQPRGHPKAFAISRCFIF